MIHTVPRDRLVSAQQPDGTTVERAAVTLERTLRACGARTAAKRLAKLTG